MRQLREPSSTDSYFWPVIWAVALHLLIFAMLFVSFQFTPDLPPVRPIIQTTLYQLNSQSQATVQTNQKIAGEAKKTAAPSNQVEQLETKKIEQQKQAAAEAKKQAEQKRAVEAKQAAEAKQAVEAKQAAETKQAAAAKQMAEAKQAAEKKRLADIARKKSEEEKKQAAADAEAAKKKADAEAAKKKADAEAEKKKAAAEAAKKKAAQEASRKAAEDKKAQALAELLAEDARYQQAKTDSVGSQLAGSLDDLFIRLVSEQWRRPPSARNGMSVEVLVEMLPDGTITNASVTRSSGDRPFDNSAVAAVRNVGRIQQMQQLDRATFDAKYRKRRIIFKPEDLSQ